MFLGLIFDWVGPSGNLKLWRSTVWFHNPRSSSLTLFGQIAGSTSIKFRMKSLKIWREIKCFPKTKHISSKSLFKQIQFCFAFQPPGLPPLKSNPTLSAPKQPLESEIQTSSDSKCELRSKGWATCRTKSTGSPPVSPSRHLSSQIQNPPSPGGKPFCRRNSFAANCFDAKMPRFREMSKKSKQFKCQE